MKRTGLPGCWRPIVCPVHLKTKTRTLMVEDLNGASRKYPMQVALGLSIAVLGLGGLPPLAGFMSKWQIFVAGFQRRTFG